MTVPSGAESAGSRHSRWAWLWAEPDVVLLDASAEGERLSGRIRILVALLVAAIGVMDIASAGSSGERLGWGVFALVALSGSLALYAMISRGFYRPWLGVLTSGLDVSVVSLGLVAFLIAGQPQLAVNSKVVYEAYFLALAATCLRYDPRICVWAGALAVLQYTGIVVYASNHWDLNTVGEGQIAYGPFSWHSQAARAGILAGFTALAAVIVQRARELHRLSTSDFLTGLHNRGYFDERVREEVIRARRHRHPLSLAMVDVDRFKNFNDTYGHSAGDLALQQIARTLKENLRLTDVVARYGGEEMVVIMPETGSDNALRKIEQIREIVAESTLELPRRTLRGVLTFSAGVASLPDDGEDVDSLVARADARLFAAKQAGRNRVMGPHDHSGMRASQEYKAV
ncbi:MAG TPA: GGDEF domain-containing protein, partial [Gemmatimonadales bacterium]|nr:GGDEF domain-containing protein [Gemmatimonadales bacterium]